MALPETHRPTRPERVSFFDEQACRRRSTWLLSLVCLLIASGLGIVLSSAVTPLLLLLGGCLLHLAAGLGITPSVSRAAAEALGLWAGQHLRNFEALIDSLDRVSTPMDTAVLLAPLIKLGPVTVPSLVAAGVLWLWLRRLNIRAGGQDVIYRLRARAVVSDDREERQLVNVIEEMAIAAGMSPPQILVIESLTRGSKT